MAALMNLGKLGHAATNWARSELKSPLSAWSAPLSAPFSGEHALFSVVSAGVRVPSHPLDVERSEFSVWRRIPARGASGPRSALHASRRIAAHEGEHFAAGDVVEIPLDRVLEGAGGDGKGDGLVG